MSIFVARGRLAIALSTPLIVAATCSDDSGTRPCPAFGSPQADAWSTGLTVGDSASYANEAGVTATLTLASRVDSEAFEGSSRFDSESVVCNLSSQRVYTVDGSDTVYQVELNQTERLGDSVTDQTLSFSVTPLDSGSETGTYNFLFSVTNAEQLLPDTLREPDISSGRLRSTRHITDLKFNSQQYSLAVEQRYDDLDDITGTSYLAAITRVIYAEQGGLVQFETQEGEIFSRVGAEVQRQ